MITLVKNLWNKSVLFVKPLVNRDWDDKIRQNVRGFMIESYLEDGRQDKPEVFGKSITDSMFRLG